MRNDEDPEAVSHSTGREKDVLIPTNTYGTPRPCTFVLTASDLSFRRPRNTSTTLSPYCSTPLRSPRKVPANSNQPFSPGSSARSKGERKGRIIIHHAVDPAETQTSFGQLLPSICSRKALPDRLSRQLPTSARSQRNISSESDRPSSLVLLLAP
jgi:hypothetical protein